MLFKYTPEGAEPQEWPFAPEKLMSSECEAIEKVTGMTYQEFSVKILDGSVMARRALLWVLLKRTEPTLRHSQVDFPAGAVELQFEQHELKALRDAISADDTMDNDARAKVVDALDEQIEDPEVEGPKAPESSDASPSSETSPTTSTSRPKLASA